MKDIADDNLKCDKNVGKLSKRVENTVRREEEFADYNLKFDEYRGELFKRIENTVGKGEIARYEQFPLFPECFQKTCTTNRYKQ